MFVGNTKELSVNSRRVRKIHMKKWEESARFSEMESLFVTLLRRQLRAGAITRFSLRELLLSLAGNW